MLKGTFKLIYIKCLIWCLELSNWPVNISYYYTITIIIIKSSDFKDKKNWIFYINIAHNIQHNSSNFSACYHKKN